MDIDADKARQAHALIGQLAMEAEGVPGFTPESALFSVSRALSFAEALLERAGIDSADGDLDRAVEWFMHGE